MKAGLRSVSIMHGVLCVMTPGIMAMRLWCVISWGIPQKVSEHKDLSLQILLHSLFTNDDNNLCPPHSHRWIGEKECSSYFSIKISTLNKCYTLSNHITLKSSNWIEWELYVVFYSFARGPSGSMVRVSDYSIQKNLGFKSQLDSGISSRIYFSFSQCTAPSDITLHKRWWLPCVFKKNTPLPSHCMGFISGTTGSFQSEQLVTDW